MEATKPIPATIDAPQPEPPAKGAGAPRRRVLLAGALALVAASIFLYAYLRPKPNAHDAASGPRAEAPPEDVVFADESQLKNLTIEAVGLREVTTDREATGKVGFNEDRLTPVFPAYSGRVVEVLANKGEIVRKGQPLLIIESPDFVAAQTDLTTTRADVEKSKITLKTAQVASERAHNLFAREAISKKDLQDAEAQLALAQGEQQRAQAALAVAQSKLEMFGKPPEDIAKLASGVDRRVQIIAPIAGTVVDRQVGPGQILKTDTPTPLFQISDLSLLWVQADVFESDLANIRLGTPVEISVASYPSRLFPARVSYIDPRVDPTTRTVHVRCQVGNSDRLLKPDMFARVRITAAAKQALPVVPSRAIVAHGEKTLVLVEEAPGRFRKRDVETGAEINGSLVIKNGLKAGERIVTQGALLLN